MAIDTLMSFVETYDSVQAAEAAETERDANAAAERHELFTSPTAAGVLAIALPVRREKITDAA